MVNPLCEGLWVIPQRVCKKNVTHKSFGHVRDKKKDNTKLLRKKHVFSKVKMVMTSILSTKGILI